MSRAGSVDNEAPRGLMQGPPVQEHVPSRLRLPPLNGWELTEVTVAQVQSHFAGAHFTSAEYVAHCLEHIRVLNPYLQAVVEINPDAIAVAEALDRERSQGNTRGPLHGIPVLVKDNIATKDRMETTAGSWALLGSVVPDDAYVVRRLRIAGAVIIGHANMSEWASVRSKVYSTGYSPRGGQTRNPFDLRKSPFGSSSGSAVAVSANIVPLALGTETDTSIIGPASANGVVGIKPTVGLTSRSGVIPISENMDSVGTFGRTLADAVACLDGIVGPDEQDPATEYSGEHASPSYLSCISTADALQGARFGLPIRRCWEAIPSPCRNIASRLIEAIVDAGAQVIDVDFPSIDERVNPDGTWDWEHGEPEKSEWTVAKVDAYNGINAYLASLVKSSVRSVEDLVEYNVQNNGTEGGEATNVPAFPDGQPNLHEMISSRGEKDETYYQALNHIRKQTRQNGIDAALEYTEPSSGERVSLDALLFCDRRGIGQQYAAQAGYPIICIPIGLDDHGMPVSISMQQTARKEAELIRWASAIEDLWNQKNGWRATPSFKNLMAKNIPVEKFSV